MKRACPQIPSEALFKSDKTCYPNTAMLGYLKLRTLYWLRYNQ